MNNRFSLIYDESLLSERPLRRTRWATVAIIVLVAVWISWLIFGRFEVFEVGQQVRIHVATNAIPVASATPGIVRSNRAELGATVHPAEVLVELEPIDEGFIFQEHAAALKAAQEKIAALNRDIKQARLIGEMTVVRTAETERVAAAELDAAEANLQHLSREHQRASRLTAEGIMPPEQLERVSRELAGAVAERTAAVGRRNAAAHTLLIERTAVNQQLQTLRFEQELAELEITKNQARLRAASARRETLISRAPVGGKVVGVTTAPEGTYVPEGFVFAHILPEGDLIATGEFPAAIIGRVRSGQDAYIELDHPLPGAQRWIEAVVQQVSQEVSMQGTARVTMRLRTNTAAVLHGATGRAYVKVGAATPLQYLLRKLA